MEEKMGSRGETVKKTWLKDLPDTQACPTCDSVMIKDERQTYTCANCGVRVWADPIGCGLVRYNILPEKKMSKTLLQLHHQFSDGTTDVCAQREVDGHGDLKRFIDDTAESHPLPVGAKWLAVLEDSPLFVRMERPPL